MDTHNICLYKVVDKKKKKKKKYTGRDLKTTELLDCAPIGACAVVRWNRIGQIRYLELCYLSVDTASTLWKGLLGRCLGIRIPVKITKLVKAVLLLHVTTWSDENHVYHIWDKRHLISNVFIISCMWSVKTIHAELLMEFLTSIFGQFCNFRLIMHHCRDIIPAMMWTKWLSFSINCAKWNHIQTIEIPS